MAAINTSVEASTLNERTFKLRPQDKFLRENIAQEDTLVVSVGGNDVALCPCPCTIVSILCLIALPASCTNNGVAFRTVPVRNLWNELCICVMRDACGCSWSQPYSIGRRLLLWMWRLPGIMCVCMPALFGLPISFVRNKVSGIVYYECSRYHT